MEAQEQEKTTHTDASHYVDLTNTVNSEIKGIECSLFLRQKLISPYRQTLWTWIRLLLGEQFDLGPQCLLQRRVWNKLAEHIGNDIYV